MMLGKEKDPEVRTVVCSLLVGLLHATLVSRTSTMDGMIVSRKFLCGRDLNGACVVHQTWGHCRLVRLFGGTGANNRAVMSGALATTETRTRPGLWESFAQRGTYYIEVVVS